MCATPPLLTDVVREPLVAFDREGRAVAGNRAYRDLCDAVGEPWRGALPRDGELLVLHDRRFLAEDLGIRAELHYWRLQPDDPSASRSRAATGYLSGLEAGCAPLRAAAGALWEGTRWRWAFVTRFDPKQLRQVQVLHWLEWGHLREPFAYAVEGTPCERVLEPAAGGGPVPVHFSEPVREFPRDAWSRRVGAREYVGCVYSTPRGVPLGHLFAISDRPRLGVAEALAVVGWLGHLVSAQTQALSWSELVDQATERAHRDALTGVANRHAFERHLEVLRRSRNGCSATVVWLDVDGLKRVNDTRGHEEGDRLLARFAHHLAAEVRLADSLFRVGGDEFVLVVEGGFDARALARRLEAIERLLAQQGFEEFSVSWGAAAVQEAEGDPQNAVRLADRRMYAMKRRRATR